MATYYFYIAIGLAILYWICLIKSWKIIGFLTKPGVILALLVGFTTASGYIEGKWWFCLALFFSLVADILLMLPRQNFLGGLGFFFLAHLGYVVGFSQTLPPASLASLIVVLGVAAVSWSGFQRLKTGMLKSGYQKLINPVLIYTLALSLMIISALMTLVLPNWQSGPALLVSSGALLFYISDLLLAWNKFLAPIQHGPLLVMVTYHLGQIMIILGVITHNVIK